MVDLLIGGGVPVTIESPSINVEIAPPPNTIQVAGAGSTGYVDAVAEALAREAGDRNNVAIVDYADKANVLVDWATTTAGGAVPATNWSVSANRGFATTTTNPGGAIIPFGLADDETGHVDGLLYWKAAAAATPFYFGIDTGTAGHSPVTGTPDGVHLGITSAAARTNAYGANHSYLIGQSDSPVSAGPNPTVDATYAFSIDIGLENCALCLRKVGSSTDIYTWWFSRKLMLQQATPRRITGISIYSTATAGAAAHQAGPIALSKSRQPARTKTLGSQLVVGAEHVHTRRPRSFGSSERYDMDEPKDYNPLVGADMALFFHWAITADSTTPWIDTRMQGLTRAVCDAGLFFAAASDGGAAADRYGAPLSIANYVALYQHAKELYNIRKLFLIGASGGGVGVMNALSHPGMPTPAGIVMIAPASNLRAVYDLDNTYATLIRNAYGMAADGSDYASKSATYDPALQSGAAFRSVSSQWFTSNSDTVVPRATHVDPMIAKMAPYAAETSLELQTGTHLTSDQFQPTKVVDFINRHR